MRRLPGIRYSFRPRSYWVEADPLAAVLRNVTGENRRQMITEYWEAGQLDQLDPALLQDEADPVVSRRLGRIHPSFLGGEFLPPYLPGEVEIARICLQSTTSDVISLRARPVPEGIAYRIEDEYRGVFTLPIAASSEPLTLAALIRQFDEGRLRELDWSGGLTLGYNNMNAEHSEPKDLRHFTRITSSVYRQLELHFDPIFAQWASDEQRARERDGLPDGGSA